MTDFLTRARERKFAVPDAAFKLALDRLRNNVATSPDLRKNGGPDLAYALYVLARNGAAPVGDLRYIADSKLNDVVTADRQGASCRGARHGGRQGARRHASIRRRSIRSRRRPRPDLSAAKTMARL